MSTQNLTEKEKKLIQEALKLQRQQIKEEIARMFNTPAFISDDPLFQKITSELQDSYKRRTLQSDILKDE